MKSLWRKIGFIVAWVILIFGTVGAIVAAVNGGGSAGFYLFCSQFIPALFFFTILMVYLEHTNNVEMRLDQTYRKDNKLPQLPESAYSNIPNFVAAATQPAPAYQQPVQPQFQQPVQPAQFQQPAPAPVPQPAPAPQPVPAPVSEPQQWACAKCGTLNNPTANFCKGCGNKKG